MPYTVEVEWASAHELVNSLDTFLMFHKYGKTLELGSGWAATVRKRGGKALSDALSPGAVVVGGVDLLVLQSPAKDSVDATMKWLGDLTPDGIYRMVLPHVIEPGRPRPAPTRQEQDDVPVGKAVSQVGALVVNWGSVVNLLTIWNEVYFRTVDPRVLEGLSDDAELKRGLIGKMAPEDLVEMATFGVRLDPTDAPVRVILIPQYHFRPWNTHGLFQDTIVYHYPVDAVPPEPGQPSPALLRLTRALSDASRLRILRFLGADARSFTDVVKFSGLAKSTVHHHMMVLRAAGLVRTHVAYPSGDPDRYSLRPGALDIIGASLAGYLKEE